MSIKTKIEQLIKHTEKTYAVCWDTLCYIKDSRFNNDTVTALLDFQIQLAEALFSIESLRQEILKEDKRLIANKSKFNIDWFIRRLKMFASYREGLKNLIVVGKSLGDAFAWWFYRFDLKLLQEHSSHERTLYPPLGIGGAGEIEFVRQIRHIQGKFIIYHGITNILRIGDVSLFDLKHFHLISLGEIKSKIVGPNKADISIIMFGPKERSFIKIKGDSKPLEIDYFNPARFERQIKSMTDALMVYYPKYTDITKVISEEFHCKEIEQLHAQSSTKKLAFVHASEGLVFSGFKTQSNSFLYKFFKHKTPKFVKKDKNTTEHILGTINKNSTQNSILVGSLQYDKEHLDNYVPGSIPLFWFPIKKNILKEIYFDDFQVVSIFNPINLILQLNELGIVVKSNFCEHDDNKNNNIFPRMTIEYFDFFVPLILNHLQSEKSIINVIKLVKDELVNKKLKNSKVELRLIQMVHERYIIPSR
jgi:hypothetical protein